MKFLIPLLVASPFIGSFVGVLVLRLPAGQPLVLARSVCDNCDTALTARDLVPILSWVVARRHCRYCGARLSAFYPAIELAAMTVVGWAATELTGWLLVASCLLGWTLLALVALDLRDWLLPDVLTLPLVAAGLAVIWLVQPEHLADHVLGAAAGLLAFTLVRWAYRSLRGWEGMGAGDAKLMASAGAWLSWQALPSVVLIAAAAALCIVLLRAFSRRPMTATTEVPFGSFLCGAIWLVWLYGPIVPG